MIDVARLEQYEYTVALTKAGISPEEIKKAHNTYISLKEISKTIDSYNQMSNVLAKNFKNLTKEDLTEASLLKEQLKTLKETKQELQQALHDIVSTFRNIPLDEVPEGENEDQNVVVEYVLEPKNIDMRGLDHTNLLDLDTIWATKITGSRFSTLKGASAKLERALINFMLDYNSEGGYTEVSLPYLVNAESMYGTGQLPKFEDDLYKTDDNLYLIPTAEVPLTNMYRDEFIPKKDLPIKMTSHTACFRKEAGSGGKDIKGLMRQHQFHKVELVAICEPENSLSVLSDMVKHVSDMLVLLELPHRIVKLCKGDLGFSASITYDIEVWIPSQNCYREISSISCTNDFQARRANIKYKDNGNHYVHTLNGSALAVGRTLIALSENHKTENGFNIPNCLEKYLF